MSVDLYAVSCICQVSGAEIQFPPFSTPSSFNEMGNVEATGNLDVTFLNAVMLCLKFGSCKQITNIRNSCTAGLQCCCFMQLIRNK